VADPEAAALARRVIRGTDFAALATATSGEDKWPYASLVMVACDHDATPLLLMSDLAEHARNIAADPRVSLLFDGTQMGGARAAEAPLDAPRVSVMGRAVRSQAPRQRARYLARNPSAERFADFGDFHIYALEVMRAHLVQGFGKVRWMEASALLYDTAPAAELIAAEPDIVGHMNEDHADAVDLYANGLLGRAGSGWRMTGIDPEGCDLRREATVARLDFEHPVSDASGARAVLVDLVEKARAAA
jgi:heme oxygenase (biliverdin-IX-beta and delta-forming)